MSVEMLSQFFLTEEHKLEEAVLYTYDYWLVALSLAVAVFASFTAFILLGRICAAPNRIARFNWLVTGAVSMGGGIWSMHFVAMLAVQMHHEMRYDPALTAVSAAVAMLASGFAFDYVSRGSRQFLRLVLAGTVLGAGIGTMHYTGMIAMRTDAIIRYDPLLFGASIVVAASLATLALRLMFHTTEAKTDTTWLHLVVTAAIMGLAITLMHYTGMSATHFFHDTTAASIDTSGISLEGSLVGFVIAVVASLILGLSWLGANIDQRMHTKDVNLRRSQGMLQAIVDTALDGIITFDKQGIVRSINPAAEKIFGYSSEEAVGQSLSMLAPMIELSNRDNRPAGAEHDENKTGFIDLSVTEGTRKDGSIVILEMSFSEMEVSDKIMHTTIVRDATERHRTEAKLRNLAAIVESSDDSIVVLDSEGTFKSWNKGAENLYGYTESEMLGRSDAILVSDQSKEGYPTTLQKVFAGETCAPEEVTRVRKDGRLVDVSLKFSPVRDVSGNITGAAVIARDITERKKTEAELVKQGNALKERYKQLRQTQTELKKHRDRLEELVGERTAEVQKKANELEISLQAEREASALQRQFVSMASHEFRTPLAIIDGAAQRIVRKTDKIGSEELKRRANNIRDAVARMLSLMEDTLSMSRLETGTIEATIQPVRIKEILRNAFEHQRILSPNARMTLSVEELSDWIDGDAAFLEQTFTNLLSNAARYSPDPARIIVTGKDDKDQFVTISVSDNGVGIPKDETTRIFDRFYRASTSSGIAGTGIGLNLVAEFVALHGGTIEVDSEVGAGSVFTVRLPKTQLAANSPRHDRNVTKSGEISAVA